MTGLHGGRLTALVVAWLAILAPTPCLGAALLHDGSALQVQLAQHLERQAPRQVGAPSLRATATGGGLASLQQVLAGPQDGVAIVRADLARAAWLGTGRFDQPHKDLRALAVLHQAYLAVLAGPAVAALSDLRGKRLALGLAATGDREALMVLLEQAGVARTDLTLRPLADPWAAVAAGEADAVFAVAAPGDASVTAALASGLHWVGLPAAKTLPESAWPFASASVDASIFKGLGVQVATLSIGHVLVGRDSLPRLEADELVEALWADANELQTGPLAALGLARAQAAMPSPVPLHSGAADAYARGGPLDKPIDVRVTVWIIDIGNIDVQKGTYDFDATLEFRWLDPRLSPSDAQPFEVMNAQAVEVTPNGYAPHGPWHSLNWRLHGTARAHFDLHRYPFDLQRFELSFEHPLMQTGELVLHCETRWHPEAGLDLQKHRLGPDFSLRDWEVARVFSEDSRTHYGPDEYFSRYTFVVEVRREVVRFLVAELAPIVLMVLMALAASLIPAEKLDAKLLLTVLSLLVAVELQVSANARLPDVGYLTVLDWAYFAAYAAMALAILQTIAEYRLHAVGRDRAAGRIRNIGAVVATLVFFVPLALMLWRRARGG